MRHFRTRHALILAAAFTAVAGCTVHPAGEHEERIRSDAAGKQYELPPALRSLPPLPNDPSPDQLVTYALLANAGVEKTYWQWKSAIEQIPQEGTQKTNLMLTYSSMIANGTTAASTNSLAAGSDPMNNLVLPGKLKTAAAIALENARAAGISFDKARFELRAQVLSAYDDYALTAELARLEQSNIALLNMVVRITQSRLGADATTQQDVLTATNELDLAKNALAEDQSKLLQQRAMLNALLDRPADAPLNPPSTLPAPRALPGDGADLLQLVARNNPELRALAAEASAKAQTIRRAKQEYWPDFSVNVSTDLAGVTQSLMGSLMLPILRRQAIDAAIRQAQADLHADEALRRQTQHDLAARVLTDIAILHDAQRQTKVFETAIIPRARNIVSAMQRTYAAGQTSMLDLLQAQRSLLALRRIPPILKMRRAQQIADLEAAAGQDFRRDAEPRP